MRVIELAAIALIAGCAPAATHAAAEGPKLTVPLACQIGRTCEVQNYVDRDPSPGVLDYRCGHRTYEGHKGVDIRVPDMAAQRSGVDVLAAAPGRVARLRDGVQDISIRAPGAPSVAGQECGNGVVIDHGDGWETQYCHVAHGSVRVKPGDVVTAGQPIAKVGLSGNTEFPHLHFQVSHGGKIVDPFAPDPAHATACTPQAAMWDTAAARLMGYKQGAVLNTGFATAAVEMGAIEAGGVPAPSAGAPAVVAYVRAIGLQAGDELELTLKGPDGSVLATNRLPPMDRDKAQAFIAVGRKRPPAGWAHGAYGGDFRVFRGGKVAMERRFTTQL